MTLATAAHRPTLLFRATAWSDRSVRRVFELAPTHTLSQLHRCLVRELRLDDDHLWAFYLSGEWFDRGSEFDGAPDFSGKAFIAQVGDLGLEPGDALAYVCDFGDEQRVDLELLGFGREDEELAQPRLVFSEGEARPSAEAFLDEDSGGAEDAISSSVPYLGPADAGEVRAALKAWDPEAADSAGRIACDPARIAAAASALLAVCPTAPHLSELGWSEGVRLDSWLGDAIRSVAAHGDPEAALRIAERFASMIRMRQPWLQAAQAFAQAGRVGPARRALEAAENADVPFHQSIRLAMAEVRLAIGDAGAAEADLRRLSLCRWPSPRVRPLAVAALAQLLERTERRAEAEALVASERTRVEALAGVIRRTEPRVGRNDPCPCGSGKKSKKCCAA
jgi:SEC-C motif/Plasmid pRiA4b ORF-3-like protein